MKIKESSRTFMMGLLAAVMLTAMAPALARIGGDDTLENDSTMVLPADTLDYNDVRRFDEFFLEAMCQKQRGSADSAFALLRHCLELDSTAAEVYFACAPFYQQQGNDSLSIECLMKAARLAPGNDTYQEYVARHYIENGDYDKAIAAYENLYSNHRDRSDVLEILFQIYYRKRDNLNTLKTLDRLEQVEGENDDITLLKMNVYDQAGDSIKAYEMLQKLVDSRPNEPSYKAMMGNWLLNRGRRDEAYAKFQAALADDPNNEFAQMSLYDYHRAASNDSAANAIRDHLLLSPKTADKTKMSMMQLYIKENEKQGGDSVPVLKLFDRVMEANPKNGDIAYLKAVYMHLKEMPTDTVIKACQKALQIEPEMAAARLDMLQMQLYKGDWDAVISTSKDGIQYDPTSVINYYFLGVGLYQKDENDAALDALRRGMNEVTSESNRNVVSDGYALMGDILYSKHRPDDAFAAYDSCLQWKSDNISALNNYAYYLGEENRDLDRAATMSQKTVEEEPDNATYLDTYAWLMFLQGRYSEAKAYIDRALEISTDTIYASADSLEEKSPDSIPDGDKTMLSDVVLEHAGDIYFHCGETSRAVELWQEATRFGKGSAVLPKKIKQRKFIPAK